jgi:hypothetical protein
VDVAAVRGQRGEDRNDEARAGDNAVDKRGLHCGRQRLGRRPAQVGWGQADILFELDKAEGHILQADFERGRAREGAAEKRRV